MSFVFSKTRYRFVNRETRSIADFTKYTHPSIDETEGYLLFLLEAAICRFTAPNLESALIQVHNVEHIVPTLEWLIKQPEYRCDALRANLQTHMKSWDLFTSRFFLNDYSRQDLSQMLTIFSTFSENTITKAIGECEPGKPLAYLSRILERM